jgi:glycosyltransferase involved in cell wall biosynthesis
MILIITDSIPTLSFRRSGIFGYNDFRFFSDNGHDVKMIILFRVTYERQYLFNFKKQINSIQSQIEEIKKLVVNNNDIEFIPYFSLIKPFVFKEDLFLFKKSRFRKHKFDSIIVHNMLHTGLNIAWIKKQFPDSQIILKEHDNWLLYRKLIRFFAVRSINKFDKILANSESTRQSFIKVFSDYKKQLKSPTPLIEINYPKFTINTKKIVKTRSRCLRILTIANLIKAKGFEESFDILKILDENKIEWFWTIIGKGNFHQNIIQLAKDNNFIDRILILSEVQKPFLYDYMEQSDVYLQLSYRETFGIAPIEAFSYYNKLIISDHITSVKELGLESNKNVLIIKDITDIFAQRYEIINLIQKNRVDDDFEYILPVLNNKINIF